MSSGVEPDTRPSRHPAKIRDFPGQPRNRAQLLDRLFFGAGTAAAVWLAWIVVASDLSWSWRTIVAAIVFWLVVAYLALPRLNRILASIYVPDYFIGRTRTSDGLLGDPLNLAAVGTPEQLATAMHRAGWTKADPVTLRSSVRIVVATLTGRSYPEAPVSPLFLFGRKQDVAYQQEVDGSPGQRHHVRFWRTPAGWPLPGGHRVDWLGGGSYDTSVGLSLFTLQVTHRIDANIDVERDYIVESITKAEPEVTVDPLVDFTSGYHARNGGGDTIHTDGTLPVIELGAVVADPDLPPLASPVPEKMPLQVLLPGVLAVLVGLASVFLLFRDGASAGTERRVILGVVAVLGIASVVVATQMLRRSNPARRLLLTLSVALVLARIVEYHTDSAAAPLHSLVPTAVDVLVLIALSSPAATAWCTRQAPQEA